MGPACAAAGFSSAGKDLGSIPYRLHTVSLAPTAVALHCTIPRKRTFLHSHPAGRCRKMEGIAGEFRRLRCARDILHTGSAASLENSLCHIQVQYPLYLRIKMGRKCFRRLVAMLSQNVEPTEGGQSFSISAIEPHT